MNWTPGNIPPEKEGWYMALYKTYAGDVYPMPLYFQMTWNVPRDFEGTIEFFSEIENLPVELVSGRIF